MFIIVRCLHGDLRRRQRVMAALPQFVGDAPGEALINMQPRHYRV